MEVKQVKILSLFRKLELIIFSLLACSNASASPIPYINQIPLLECVDQKYEIWIQGNEIRNIINNPKMLHKCDETYRLKVLNVDFNFMNTYLISFINRAISFLNKYLVIINDKLNGKTCWYYRGIVFDFEDNVNTLNRVINSINSLILNWLEHPNVFRSIIPRLFEEVYYHEDIILEDLKVNHVSFYKLKRNGCLFFQRLKYPL